MFVVCDACLTNLTIVKLYEPGCGGSRAPVFAGRFGCPAETVSFGIDRQLKQPSQLLWRGQIMLSNAIRISRSCLRVGGLLGLISLVSLLGCGAGSDDLPTAKVSGKVTANGAPVTGGDLVFAPIGKGKNAGGTVGSDGSFTLTTYIKDDGAIVGKHKVTFTPASVAAPSTPAGGHTATPASPYAGMVPKEAEITISAGENKIDIELVKSK
jgi:hypothetical protein